MNSEPSHCPTCDKWKAYAEALERAVESYRSIGEADSMLEQSKRTLESFRLTAAAKELKP